MPRCTWRGGAVAVTQETRFTPSAPVEDDIFILTATAEDGTTINSVSFQAPASPTVAQVVTGLVNAWNDSSNYLMTPVTAQDHATHLLLVADVAGRPFYVGGSVTGSGSLAEATDAASEGPNDWNTADNWEVFDDDPPGGALAARPPQDSNDEVYIEGNFDIKYGLDQSGVTVGSLRQGTSFTGELGDSEYGYYLRLNGTRFTTDSPHRAAWLKGAWSEGVYINRTGGGGNALQLAGGPYPGVRVTGQHSTGTITIADGTELTGIFHMLGCPGIKAFIGDPGAEAVPLALVARIDTGELTSKHSAKTVTVGGGRYNHTKGDVEEMNVTSGSECLITAASNNNNTGKAMITTLTLYGGTTGVNANEDGEGLEVTNTVVEGPAKLIESGSPNRVLWPNPVIVNSAQSDVQVSATVSVQIDV